jgi:hypothetical protein
MKGANVKVRKTLGPQVSQAMMDYMSGLAPDRKTGCSVCGETWYMGEDGERYCEMHWARREGYACMEEMEAAEDQSDVMNRDD